MPFAGHPVIGSTFALADDGVIAAGTKTFMFGLNIGPTLVELEWKQNALAFAWMTQQPPVFGATLPDAGKVAAAYGLPADALHPGVPVQEVNCGSAFFMLALKTRAAVDQAALRRAGHRRGLRSGTAAASRDLRVQPRAGSRRRHGLQPHDRRQGGSRHGFGERAAGRYLVRHGLVPLDRAANIVSAQGVKMNRPSRIHIRIDGTSPDRHHPRASWRHQRPRRRGLAAGFLRLGAWRLGAWGLGLGAWAWAWGAP